MDVILKKTDNELLESLIPIDRVVNLDSSWNTYLFDTCFNITEDMIEEIIKGNN